MSNQQELQRALDEFRRHIGADTEDDEEPIGEYKAAEYIIFALALDTYARHLEESIDARLKVLQARLGDPTQDDALKAGWGEEIAKLEAVSENPVDSVIQAGVALLRRLDTELETFQNFVQGHLPRPSQQKMLDRALRMSVRGPKGIGRRALGIRTVLSLGGPKTVNGIFESAQARRQIKAAIAASMLDDGDAALDLFASMPASVLRNPRIRAWIQRAAETALPLSTFTDVGLPGIEIDESAQQPRLITPPATNPINNATVEAVEQAPKLLAQQAQQDGATAAEDIREAQQAQDALLSAVQQQAAEAARETMERNGESDEPPNRSEVVGIATAAAIAAMSDPSNPQNVPETLKRLDPEQRAAAVTDGRVLVAAGAGAGKSTTLVARVNHLVRERGVAPNRILVTSFNTEAAEELKIKLGKSAGEAAGSMKVGTMHSLFKRFVLQYGTREEREAMKSDPQQVASLTARTVQNMWASCFDKDTMPTPPLKAVKQQMTLWSGNNISVAQAKAEAVGRAQIIAAQWYEMYEGLKGAFPGWRPPCEEKARQAAEDEYQEKYDRWQYNGGRGRPPKKPMTSYEWYMSKLRPNGERAGDFEDMIRMFRDLLKRNVAVRKEVQSQFDHVCIDECQDLNQVQFEAFEMMTEHVGDGSDGRSVWMVGDDKQSIYGFRGARPDLFQGLHEKEGWTTRMIRTNYRCPPEIVEHANKLIGHNQGQIPMEANANPTRPRGEAGIEVTTPPDSETGAIAVAKEIITRKNANPNASNSDFAVLCRTNKELHAYEAACLIQGIPYARKGASSFLGSPEVKALLGYVDLVMGVDNEKLQKSLADVINTPRRFWGFDVEQSDRAVKDALRDYARATRMDLKAINPVEALRDSSFREILAQRFDAGHPRGRKYADVMGQIRNLSDFLDNAQANAAQPGYQVKDLFNEVLLIEGKVREIDPDSGRAVFAQRSFRESIEVSNRDRDDESDEIEAQDDEDEDDAKGLGNISFLYELAKVDPNNPPDTEEDPSTPAGFLRKMDQLRAQAEDLRIDVNKWKKAQQDKPPEDRLPPPGVYLGTVHSVKGAQWPNVFVQMPKGKFPMETRPKPNEPPPTEEEVAKQREQERRLAYVAVTRASTNLSIVCPRSVAGSKDGGISPFVQEGGFDAYLTQTPTTPPPSPEAPQIEPEVLSEPVPVREASAGFFWEPFDEPLSWDPFGG